MRLRQAAGPFTVTVFTAPEPLAAGPADVSVLVQDRASGEPVLDAQVEIRLRAPGAEALRSYAAAPGSNRLLKAAGVELAVPGQWKFEVVVRHAGEVATVEGVVPVGPPVPRLVAVWPYLAAPPLAIVLFVLLTAIKRKPRAS